MNGIKLFHLKDGIVSGIPSQTSHLEKPLQTLIEANLPTLLAIRFLSSEYSTGKTHAGRIDTLGLDENNCPVIIEYKRSSNENVINQGLFYLDWLMDHKAEFKWLVLETFDEQTANEIDWSAPRLICIASDFTKYDSHAVQQINRNIDLIRYRYFGKDLLLFEHAYGVTAKKTFSDNDTETLLPASESTTQTKIRNDKTISEWLDDMPDKLAPIFSELENFIMSLGDDIQKRILKFYIAYTLLKNFASVVIQKSRLVLYLHLNPDEMELEEGFRNVRGIGHHGTGDLEISVTSLDDLEKVKPLIQAAYDGGDHES